MQALAYLDGSRLMRDRVQGRPKPEEYPERNRIIAVNGIKGDRFGIEGYIASQTSCQEWL